MQRVRRGPHLGSRLRSSRNTIIITTVMMTGRTITICADLLRYMPHGPRRMTKCTICTYIHTFRKSVFNFKTSLNQLPSVHYYLLFVPLCLPGYSYQPREEQLVEHKQPCYSHPAQQPRPTPRTTYQPASQQASQFHSTNQQPIHSFAVHPFIYPFHSLLIMWGLSIRLYAYI